MNRPDSTTGNKLKVGGHAGSDTDAGTRSDINRRLKKKNISSNQASRAGSPAPPVRASSPVQAMSTAEEIRNIVLSFPEGLSVAELLSKVRYPPEKKTEFVNLMKTVVKAVNKRVVLLNPPSANAGSS